MKRDSNCRSSSAGGVPPPSHRRASWIGAFGALAGSEAEEDASRISSSSPRSASAPPDEGSGRTEDRGIQIRQEGDG